MSTASEIGRIPAFCSRRCSQIGERASGSQAGDRARGEAVAADRVGDLDRVAVRVRRGHVEERRVAQRQAVRDGGLAGDAAHGQAVAAVRGDGDVEDLVDELEQLDRVGAGLVLRRQHDDAVRAVVAHAELVAGADHAVRGLAVRLARGDREVAGQHGAGEDHDDLVADGEVTGAADDLLRFTGAVGGADVDGAEADGLLEALQLLDGQDLSDDEGALEAGADLLDGLDLEADGDELGLHVTAGLARGQVDVLPQPGKRDAHQISIPNGRVKRTSPSTMSRMSSTLWRNIRSAMSSTARRSTKGAALLEQAHRLLLVFAGEPPGGVRRALTRRTR